MGKVLITGTSSGVGRASALKFLSMGFTVVGLDWKCSTINHKNYTHYVCDVSKFEDLPDVGDVTHVVNNAGIVTPKAQAMLVNAVGYMNIIEKYCYQPTLESIINIGSTASTKGFDNLPYCASQGARDALTKWCTTNFSSDSRHVNCNSINLDGIIPGDENGIGGTSMEPALYADESLMEQITNVSILKRLTTVEEIADWVYFVSTQKCMTGQILNIDGELPNYRFVKYPGWDD